MISIWQSQSVGKIKLIQTELRYLIYVKCFFRCLLLLSEPQYVHLLFCSTDYITSLLPGMPKDIWIGLQFLFSTRENKWIDDSRLLYSNFHPLLTGRLRKIPLDVSSDL